MLYRNLRFPILSLLTALVVACGGGGGGSSFQAPNISTTPVSITSGNAETVADSAVESVEVGSEMTFAQDVAGGSFKAGDGASGSTVLSVLLGQMQTGVDMAVASGGGQATAVGVTQSETQGCTNGGSITITATTATQITDVSQFQDGDTFSLSANNCKEGAETVNGTVSFTINDGALTDISVNINNFRVSDSVQTVTVHGDIGMVMSWSLFDVQPTDNTVTVSGSSLWFVVSGGDAIHLTDYSVEVVTTGTSYLINSTMTVDSTLVNGRLTITSIDVAGDTFGANPTSGTIIVDGNNETLTLTLDATNVNWSFDDLSTGVGEDDAGMVAWTVINA